jgi:sugar (glycoside-pentoside-hexuronide) transporter
VQTSPEQTEEKSMSKMIANNKLTVTEKLGYGLGDAACNFIFQTLMYFQLSFYTDTFGISASAAGTMFLVVGLGSAFFDPIMGVIADRTNTRFGKFRPWVLAGAIPYGIMSLVAFSTPNISPSGKVIFAWVTYTLLLAVYSVVNVPYAALSGVITGDPNERTSVQSYRFALTQGAIFVVSVLALPMFNFFGHGNNAKGYQWTMGTLAVASTVFLSMTFFTTKERIQPAPGQKTSIGQDLADLVKNGPWIALFAVTVFYFVALSLRNAMMVYYFKYFVGHDNLYSIFNIFSMAGAFAGIFISPLLTKRWGKRNVLMATMAVTGLLTSGFMLLPAEALAATYALETLRALAFGVSSPLLWAMMADVADFSEWKTGRRATAMVFAATVFALKAGLALGRALGGWLLSHFGYLPDARQQTAQGLSGIRLTASVIAGAAFLGVSVCLIFYGINKTLNRTISDELTERRKGYKSAA